MGYYLSDSIYQSGLLLCRLLTIHEALRNNILQWNKNHVGKTWNAHLEFSNHGLPLYKDWHDLEKKKKHVLHDIMIACIIMHNMIIEDERDLNAPIEEAVDAPTPTVKMVVAEHTLFQEFLSRHYKVKDKDAHIARQHINWTLVGGI